MKITYTIKLYGGSKNRHLSNLIDCAGEIWNYCVAHTKEHYETHQKLPTKYDLQKHLTHAKKLEEYSHWNFLGSQAIQDVTDRLYRSYQQFYRLRKEGKKVSPPHFRKLIKYRSFTLKQTGYKFQETNKVRVGTKVYKYHKSREIEGTINTITIKRDPFGDIYLFVTCTIEDVQAKKLVTPGKIVGIDFGMKTFLTLSDGTRYQSPLFYTKSLSEMKVASRQFSTKQRGSRNRYKAYLALAGCHKKIRNQRRDYQHKLARSLCEKYNALCIEDLHIAGMKKLWGRKISDLGFAEFVGILKHHCAKTGTILVVIDRYEPTSKQCHNCLVINEKLKLSDRVWTCDNCHMTHDRDSNAAKNIARVGASTLGIGVFSQPQLAATA